MPLDVKTELDKLAKKLIDEVTTNKEVAFEDMLGTFKELRAYYALTLKEAPDNPDEDESEGFSFENGLGERHDGTRVQRRGNS